MTRDDWKVMTVAIEYTVGVALRGHTPYRDDQSAAIVKKYRELKTWDPRWVEGLITMRADDHEWWDMRIGIAKTRLMG